MLDYASWPKVLTVTGALAVWIFGGMWIVGTYMLSDVERSISEFRAEAGERFSVHEQEDSAARAELAETMRELRVEVAALRKEVGALGNRVVASNGKVGDRIDILRKELAAALEKHGERFDATVARLDRDAGAMADEIDFFDRGWFKPPSKGKTAFIAPPMNADATP